MKFVSIPYSCYVISSNTSNDILLFQWNCYASYVSIIQVVDKGAPAGRSLKAPLTSPIPHLSLSLLLSSFNLCLPFFSFCKFFKGHCKKLAMIDEHKLY